MVTSTREPGLAAGGAQDRRVRGIVEQRVGVRLDRNLGLGSGGTVDGQLHVLGGRVVHSTDHAARLVLAVGDDHHVAELQRTEVGPRSVRRRVLLSGLLGVDIAAAGYRQQADAKCSRCHCQLAALAPVHRSETHVTHSLRVLEHYSAIAYRQWCQTRIRGVHRRAAVAAGCRPRQGRSRGCRATLGNGWPMHYYPHPSRGLKGRFGPFSADSCGFGARSMAVVCLNRDKLVCGKGECPHGF